MTLPEFRLPLSVDSTLLDAARVCPERFALEHGRGLASPNKPVDLVAGGAFAAARAAFYAAAYAGRTRNAAFDEARAAFDAEWGGFELPPDSKSPKTRDRTWALLADRADGYVATFDPPNDRLVPAKSLVDPPFEWPFRIALDAATLGTAYEWPRHPSGESFEYVGRLDAVVRFGDTVTVGLDDKTTSRFSAVDTWVASLQMRAQIIGYRWVLSRQIDPECDSFVVRQGAIRSSGVEWRESPLIPIPRVVVERWLRTTRDTLSRLVAWTSEGEFPRAFGEACVAWSRPCAFLGACRSGDPTPHLEGFVERRWSPLSGTDLASE